MCTYISTNVEIQNRTLILTKVNQVSVKKRKKKQTNKKQANHKQIMVMVLKYYQL